MSDELNTFLDGEGDRDDLSPAQLEEARAWERLVATLRADAPGPAPSWLEARIMSEVRSVGDARAGFMDWLLRPRSLRASPLAIGVALAGLAAIMAIPWLRAGAVPGRPGAGAALFPGEPVVYVQFVLEAPGAGSVAVAGDFNEWGREHLLDDADGDGVWTGRVPVRPGVHEYMFILDGDEWVTDPRADRYVADGFGGTNAVLAIADPGRT